MLQLHTNFFVFKRHQKIRQRARDAASKARRRSRKEAEKPWELLSVMKSQSWFPQEGSVRRLLCADPSCPICNAVALEIKQLLASENTPISPTSSRPSQGSSCLEILSMSNLSLDQSQGSQHSKELPIRSASPSMSQLTDQKSLTRSAAQATSAVSIQDYWADHCLRQGFQAPDVSWDVGRQSSSNLEECRMPVSQRDKKSNTECNWEKQARRCSRKEAEKPWELLSVMKSQNWLPQEGSVRRLLCADTCCQICNAMALEIQQLLVGESTLISQTSPGSSQYSPCLEIFFKSNVSKEISYTSATLSVSQFTDQKSLTLSAAQSASSVSIQDYLGENLQLGQAFQVPEIPRGPETMALSKLEKPTFPVNQEEMIQHNLNLVYEHHGQQPLHPQVSLLTLNQEITAMTHSMAVPTVTVVPTHLPFLSPKILRLLEVHVKKWMHFQRWGLPRRVEESFRQLMPNPPLFYQPVNTQPVPFIQNDTSEFSVERYAAISYQTWGSCMAGQATQAFWVSEWSIMHPIQRQHYQKNPHHVALAFPSPAHKDLSGLYPVPEQQANDTVGHLKQKYNQLFCGLPSLHSESLDDTLLGSQDHSTNGSMSKLPSKDPFLSKELSSLPLLPKTPPQSTPHSSPSSPNWVTPSDHQQAQINIPFLTLAECKALEWHLVQRQLQLQWGLPVISQRAQNIPSPMQHKSCDTNHSSETMKISWPRKPISILTRQLFFLPKHGRRLLKFHLQRQLIHHRWGLPQKIQQSFQLFLSPTQQQTPSWTSTVLANVSLHQPSALEATGAGDPFSPCKDPVSVLMPCLFDQVKAILQTHMNSKCVQIHEGKVPVHVYRSCECIIPGDLEVPSFTCIPEGKPLELQAATDPDLQQKFMLWMPTTFDQEQQTSPGAVIGHPKVQQTLSKEAIEKLEVTLQHKYLTFLSGLELQAATDPDLQQKFMLWMPTSLDQEQQASPGAVIGHPKVHQTLSKEAIEKLEMTLQHKYLTLLSGLPVLSYMAPSKATTPAVTTQATITEVVPEHVEILTVPLTQMISSEEQCLSPGPCFQGVNETCAEIADEFQSEVQMERIVEMETIESQTEPASPYLLNKPILVKLNFHLRRKILETQWGIPTKARESREQTVAIPESISTQESLVDLNNQGKSLLPDLIIPPDTPNVPDPKWLYLKEQLAIELKAVQQNQTQLRFKAAPPCSAHEPSKISEHSRDMTEGGQVLCVQLEASVNNPSLEEPWSSSSQCPRKSKDSAQVPMLTEKKEDPGKPKSARDHGEGDAGFALSSKRGNSHPAEAQGSERMLLNRTHQNPSQQRHSCHLDAPSQHSSQHGPRLKPPELPLGVPGEKKSKNDLLGSQTRLNVSLKPARISANAQPVGPQMSQGKPVPGQLTQHKPLQRQPLQGQVLQGQVMPAHTHKRPSLSESSLRNKVKFFLQSISLKAKGKGHKEPMFLTAEKMANARKQSVEKRLAPVKTTREQTQTEKKTTGDPKAQSPLTKRQAGLAFLDGSHSPDSKLWHRSSSSQLHSASVLSHPHHCPRHCPQVACATQSRNPLEFSTLISEGTTASLKKTQNNPKTS